MNWELKSLIYIIIEVENAPPIRHTFPRQPIRPTRVVVEPLTIQNAFIESFNGRMRDELLNEALFFGKHARRTAGLLRARVSSDSYDARRVRQLVRKQMLRFAASTPMGGVRAGGFAGLKRCG